MFVRILDPGFVVKSIYSITAISSVSKRVHFVDRTIVQYLVSKVDT